MLVDLFLNGIIINFFLAHVTKSCVSEVHLHVTVSRLCGHEGSSSDISSIIYKYYLLIGKYDTPIKHIYIYTASMLE